MRTPLGLTVCAVVAVVLLMLTGCLPTSLEPLYTEKDLVSNDGLVGRWTGKDDNDKEVWEFTSAGDKQYRLVITDEEGKKSELDIRLVKLGDNLFLDMFPAQGPLEKMNAGGMYGFHLAQLHSFFKVEIKDKQLVFHFFDLERLTKMLQEKPDLIPSYVTKDRLIFTASTEVLQKFVIQQAAEPKAFGDPTILVPAKPAKPASESPQPAAETQSNRAGQ